MLSRTTAHDLAAALLELDAGQRASLAARDDDLAELIWRSRTDDQIPQRAAELARQRLEERTALGYKVPADLLAELDREAA